MKPSRTLSGLPRDRSLPHPNVLHFLSIEKLRPPGLFPEFQRANLIREVKENAGTKENSQVSENSTSLAIKKVKDLLFLL